MLITIGLVLSGVISFALLFKSIDWFDKIW